MKHFWNLFLFCISGNEVLEIRLRALKSIELQFKVYDHLNFNGPFLMKALIKWFDFHPTCEEIRVLHLIHNILKVCTPTTYYA